MKNEPVHHLKLEHWSAWSPGISTEEDWRQWAGSTTLLSTEHEKPAAKFLPAATRRRCSAATRAALTVAQACYEATGQQDIPTVFSTRRGESETTLNILQSLARREPVSPNKFSLSVHNTASGLFSIVNGNRAPSTAIAAGGDEFFSLIFEALTFLKPNVEDSNKKVLCVFSDPPLPEPFSTDDLHYPMYALAFVVSQADNPEESQIHLHQKLAEENAICSELPESVLRWLMSSSSNTLAPVEEMPFTLSRAEGDLFEYFRSPVGL